MKLFGIPNKLVRLMKVTMNDSTYHDKIGLMITDGFKEGNGLKPGDGLPLNLLNTTMEYVTRQLSVEIKSTIFYKSVQLIGYADDINIMGRIIRALCEVCKELKGTAKEVGLNISVEKNKSIVHSRRTKIIRKILTMKDHDVEVVRRFKYLGTVINNTNNKRQTQS